MLKDEYKVYEDKMKKSIESVAGDFAAVRAGRANASVLNRIMVDYYGTPTPIQQVASITAPDAKTLAIQPWEKSIISKIEKAILDANLGFTPSNNGEIIRCVVPALTEERRRELIKKAKTAGESSKIVVRNSRRDAVDALKKAQKNEGLSEDTEKEAEDEVQKLTDKFVKKVDETIATKEKDILTV